jgi:hypothetical protein
MNINYVVKNYKRPLGEETLKESMLASTSWGRGKIHKD